MKEAIGGDRAEMLWNALRDAHSVSLFCAYPIRQFGDPTLTSHFLDVCDEYTQVIPAETYTLRWTRTMNGCVRSPLSNKAILLQAEIREREKLEEQLRRREKELTDFIAFGCAFGHPLVAQMSLRGKHCFQTKDPQPKKPRRVLISRPQNRTQYAESGKPRSRGKGEIEMKDFN
jgi:hypothetical protein